MLTICAWCLTYDSKLTILKHGNSEEGISHGICKECRAKDERQFKENMRESKWF